jgi:hypothetical protein
MSRYGYDYSLAPRATTGWRSRFATVMTVGTIVAISAVSGAAVAVNLLGPAGTPADRPAIFALRAPASSAPVAAQTVTPAAKETVAVAPSRVPPAAVEPASPPTSAPAPQPKPAVVAVEPPPTAHMSESELTFSRGYARRRAIQAAADAASAPKSEGLTTEVAGAETQGQLGRSARKPKVVAHANQDPRRVAEIRDESGLFSRFDQPRRYDFGRSQALAYGDSRDPRANRRSPHGGLFGGSPSGFFGGLF